MYLRVVLFLYRNSAKSLQWSPGPPLLKIGSRWRRELPTLLFRRFAVPRLVAETDRPTGESGEQRRLLCPGRRVVLFPGAAPTDAVNVAGEIAENVPGAIRDRLLPLSLTTMVDPKSVTFTTLGCRRRPAASASR